MRYVVSLLFLVSVFFGVPSAHAQSGGKRMAIVIGNSAYELGSLANPSNDSELIGNTLREFGFEVHQAVNLTTPGFATFFDSLKDEAKNADVVFFYYAGHAFQYRGDNRLLMVDATARDIQAVLSHSISLSDLVQKFSALNPRSMVLALDSCRDNPFAEGKKEIESGLSYLETGQGQIMIAYATSAGQVARDGLGANSPYAVALANALTGSTSAKPSLSDVFRRVRRDVREATNGLQVPWVSSSIESEIILARTSPVPDAGALNVAKAPTPEEVLWHFVQTSGNLSDIETYLKVFPQGTHFADARTAVERGSSATRALFSDAAGTDIATKRASPLAQEVVMATTGDRSPPAELRAWPRQLPAVANGLRSLINDCDMLASDPDDPARVAPGVQIGMINVRQAAIACILTIVRNPSDGQALFQMGRTLDAARLYPWAIAFYQQAIDLGYSAAMVNLGFLYRNGRGVPQDEPRAFRLYKQAALTGNLRARTNIGTMFRMGQGVPQSFQEALLWYRLAGGTGWPNAIDALAGMYAQGQGVEKSPERAARLYLSAAEVGQTNAMNNLGKAYMNGEGVERDLEEAQRWLEAGTAAGNKFAPQSLAKLIAPKDSARAESLLLQSAERGNPAARIDLALLYKKKGDKKARVEAYYQLQLAAALKVEAAAGLAAQFEEGLSEKQIADTKRRAEDWVKENGN